MNAQITIRTYVAINVHRVNTHIYSHLCRLVSTIQMFCVHDFM